MSWSGAAWPISLDEPGGEAELVGDRGADPANPDGVLVGALLVQLGRDREALERLQPRALQLSGTLADDALEHPLPCPQTLLGALQAGDVVDHALGDLLSALGQPDGDVADPDLLAGLGAHPVVGRVGLARAQRPALVGDRQGDVVGVDLPAPEAGIVAPLLRGEAEHRRDVGADVLPSRPSPRARPGRRSPAPARRRTGSEIPRRRGARRAGRHGRGRAPSRSAPRSSARAPAPPTRPRRSRRSDRRQGMPSSAAPRSRSLRWSRLIEVCIASLPVLEGS